MFEMSGITHFICRFLLFYSLCLAPWPGWDTTYNRFFRQLIWTTFNDNDGKRILKAEPARMTKDFSSLDTELTLGNRDLLDHTGTGPVEILDLNARAVGWIPTALTLSLIFATPMAWRPRLCSLTWGLLCVHCYILLGVASFVWSRSPGLALSSSSPFAVQLCNGLEEVIINQMGAGFVIPVFIWLPVATLAFRTGQSEQQPD